MNLLARAGLAAALVFSTSIFARSQPISQLQPSGYVNDFAHVLDESAIAQTQEICQQIDEKANAQIAVVTITSLDGSDLESYAVNLFQKWGIGSKSTNRGVLILYAIQDRKARIEVGYGLEPILPDGKVGSFQREAIPLMRSGDYSKALLLVTTRVADVIASDAGIQLTTSQPRAPTKRVSEPERGLSLGGIVLIVIIVLIIFLTPLRSLFFWLLLSQVFGGRGGGGFGGGGFGGGGGSFGGGGGFGGFGGGSSGGGGASSSW